MWTTKIPVLRSDHLKPETTVWLTNTDDMLVATYDGGCFVFVGLSCDNAPRDMVTVTDWAHEQGFEWLRFDAAGDTVEALPLYEWR